MTSTSRPLSATHSYAKVLAVLVAGAALATLPYSTQLTSQLPGYRRPNPFGQAVGLLFNIGLSYAVIRVSLGLGRRVDLGWPPIDGWDREAPSPTRARRALVSATLLGTAAGLCLGIAAAVFKDTSAMRETRDPTVLAAVLASIGAGIYEEVWFRLGAMTMFAWMLTRLSALADSRRAVVWSANLLAAALFGAAHLPLASTLTTLTPTLIVFVLAANGIVGVICGWLYWRRGLFAAIVAHTTVDLILKVGLPLLRASA